MSKGIQQIFDDSIAQFKMLVLSDINNELGCHPIDQNSYDVRNLLRCMYRVQKYNGVDQSCECTGKYSDKTDEKTLSIINQHKQSLFDTLRLVSTECGYKIKPPPKLSAVRGAFLDQSDVVIQAPMAVAQWASSISQCITLHQNNEILSPYCNELLYSGLLTHSTEEYH